MSEYCAGTLGPHHRGNPQAYRAWLRHGTPVARDRRQATPRAGPAIAARCDVGVAGTQPPSARHSARNSSTTRDGALAYGTRIDSRRVSGSGLSDNMHNAPFS
ncbi:hypothetical protein LMG27177_06509 [Paraburkholderia fynbosensis]|uniref:Uncharacterized protein n=1 Tax=Paraburkholderia fynbosensis TaxID=1200993 RepID=A0A6J5H3E3_9BURK|nr:hypothetical protein LMG27177_06509 [Paraburkholderia fynbosensis]